MLRANATRHAYPFHPPSLSSSLSFISANLSESRVRCPVLLFYILPSPCVLESLSFLSVHARSDALSPPPLPRCTVLCEWQNERNLWESGGTSDQAARLCNGASDCEFGNRTRQEGQTDG